ncbi:MAG TPA: class I SAM-dependent methyltransferase [Actinomycetota bacterium]|nr:class I SAM-dependent methyltransferase [Actinomycetota bacterium]
MRPDLQRDLPPRYARSADELLRDRFSRALAPGARVLDVGGGRRPVIPPELRPEGCHYVGMDISGEELERSEPGAYDEKFVADATKHVSELEGRFDLIVSRWLLEHVKPLPLAFENFRSYLRPGGLFVATFSGRFSLFGLINQLVPHRVAQWAVHRFLGRSKDAVFPAYYHRCWYTAVQDMLRPWSGKEIYPLYIGARYFAFFRPLLKTYLAYENWTHRSKRRNLATHYLVAATR